MQLGIIGTSIWQQNMPLLERLSIDPESKATSLQELKAALGVDELIHLSTCNRVEVIYVSQDEVPRGRLLHRLIDYFFKGNCDVGFFPNDFYHFLDKEAVSHLFRTVSSLESLVIGETQITGQFKDAFQEAKDAGLTGPVLQRLGQQALNVAKKVKRETSVGRGSVSMASLASEVLLPFLEGRQRPMVALIGAGPMTEKSAKHLTKSRTVDLLFVNRTLAKAELLARQFEGRAISLDDFKEDPGQIEAIITATSSTEPVFCSDFLQKLAALPRQVICVDLALPRDFSTDFDVHPGVTLIDIPQLKARGNGNLRQKFIEASHANEIVRQEVASYLSNRVETSLKPIFQESYQESVQLARQSLEKLFANKLTSLDEEQQEAVHRLVNKLIGHASFQSVKMLSEQIVDARGELNLDHLELPQQETP